MVKCNSCGWTNFDDAKCCEKCGNPLYDDVKETVRHPNGHVGDINNTQPLDSKIEKKGNTTSIVIGVVEILVGLALTVSQVIITGKNRGFLYYLGLGLAITGGVNISSVIKKNKENKN